MYIKIEKNTETEKKDEKTFLVSVEGRPQKKMAATIINGAHVGAEKKETEKERGLFYDISRRFRAQRVTSLSLA